jgi:FkbM family methyltransferase
MSQDNIPFLLRLLTGLTRLLPPFWRISGVSNRFVKPIWCMFGDGKTHVLPVWQSIRMEVDPCEVVGGNLAFIPQLYDRWERTAIQDVLPRNGIFIDVGSNIGAYALWAASLLGETGRVLALEADPDNFALLRSNIVLNDQDGVVTCVLGGVADSSQTLRFYKNTNGNRGGHSFVGTGDQFTDIQCKPLLEILETNNVGHVDFMKLDIEGFEEKVLSKFFANTIRTSPLRPTYLLVEIQGGPVADVLAQERLKAMICSHGYEMLVDKSNSFFKKTAAQ